jgi:hypothetical protein
MCWRSRWNSCLRAVWTARFSLTHPLGTRAIAAARLARADLLREALTGLRSVIKSRVHVVLAKHGVTRRQQTCSARAAARFFAELALRGAPRRRLGGLMSLVEGSGREIIETTKEIEARAKTDGRRCPHPDPCCWVPATGGHAGYLSMPVTGIVSSWLFGSRTGIVVLHRSAGALWFYFVLDTKKRTCKARDARNERSSLSGVSLRVGSPSIGRWLLCKCTGVVWTDTESIDDRVPSCRAFRRCGGGPVGCRRPIVRRVGNTR